MGLCSQGKLGTLQFGTLIMLGRMGWDLALKANLAQYNGNFDYARQGRMGLCSEGKLGTWHSTHTIGNFDCTGGIGM
jgi:hypothetical protein